MPWPIPLPLPLLIPILSRKHGSLNHFPESPLGSLEKHRWFWSGLRITQRITILWVASAAATVNDLKIQLWSPRCRAWILYKYSMTSCFTVLFMFTILIILYALPHNFLILRQIKDLNKLKIAENDIRLLIFSLLQLFSFNLFSF